MRTLALLVLASAAFLGCGGGGGSGIDAGDAAPSRDATDVSTVDGAGHGGSSCTQDVQCDDGVFCNGAERCIPGAPGADARGCVAAAGRCRPSETCDEAGARCIAGCAGASDADGDGHVSTACGGDDCDDHDPRRFPGNTEVCAVAMASDGTLVRVDPTHDEDCDPTTFANAATHDGDHDGDGYVDRACCNLDRNGMNQCGTDCADTGPAVGFAGTAMMVSVAPADVHPAQPEVCNGVDDNCNDVVDDGVARTFFPDRDHDNYGDGRATPVHACAPTAGYAENGLDCDDTSAAISPVASEVCNGVDDNCDGRVDEAPATAIACEARYGSPPNTSYACNAGMCAVGTCAGTFLDCDGRLDDGCETDGSSDARNCGACGRSCGAGGVCTAGACDPIVQISAGADYACAVRASHRVVCWGENDEGQLGDGTGAASTTPIVVPGVLNAVAVSATRFEDDWVANTCETTCAQDGATVVCWGCSVWGQQGIGPLGTGFDVYAPSLPAQGLPVYDRTAGVGTTMHLTVAGGYVLAGQYLTREAVYSWGTVNGYNPLGRTPSADSPASVPGAFDYDPAHATESDAPLRALSAGKTHACALTATHGLLCWGRDDAGQIGGGAPLPSDPQAHTAPTLVAVPSGATGWIDVSAGAGYTCAVADDDPSPTSNAGRVFCWGAWLPGASALAPVAVPGIAHAVAVAAGRDHTCALIQGGTVACWGSNREGALGDGTTTDRTSPVAVGGLTGVTQLSVGRQLSCALSAPGVPYCWGHFGGTHPTRVAGL